MKATYNDLDSNTSGTGRHEGPFGKRPEGRDRRKARRARIAAKQYNLNQ